MMTYNTTSRRQLLVGAAALAAAPLARPALAQGAPVKIGLMLPFSGTFASLGENIAAAFEMYLAEKGGKLGGRPIQVVRLDDESDPAKSVQNVNRLVGRERVGALVDETRDAVLEVERDDMGHGGALRHGRRQ